MATTKVGRFKLGGAVFYTGYSDDWALYLAKVKADIRTVGNKVRSETKRMAAKAAGR